MIRILTLWLGWALLTVITVAATTYLSHQSLIALINDWASMDLSETLKTCAALAGLAALVVSAGAGYLRVVIASTNEPDYRMWLISHGWTGTRPPFGSVIPGLREVAFIAAIICVSGMLINPIPAAAAALSLVGGWCLGVVRDCWLAGERRGVLGLIVLLSTIVFIEHSAVAALLIVSWIIILGCLARRVRRQAAAIPAWPTQSNARTKVAASWPYSRTRAPSAWNTPLRRRFAAIVCLISWFAFAVGWYLTLNRIVAEPESADFLRGLACLIPAVPLLWAMYYRALAAPPGSLFERVISGRWFMPAYHRVFVVPLGCLLAASAIGWWAWHGLPPVVAVPLGLLLGVLPLAMSEAPQHWLMTGSGIPNYGLHVRLQREAKT